MPHELITLQIGQCGNQIGRQFWQLVLQEHAINNKYKGSAFYDDSMSTFFRNVDSKYSEPVEIPYTDGTLPISSLKARAILVDMEEGPVAETLAGPLGGLFDQSQLVTDVSGAGNNWAHGYCVYGPQYRDNLLDKLHYAVELCDSLQSFFVLHSLGGGTGSGLGTYILGLLQDEYPDIYRFSTCVFPSEDDDVITSPYNSVLSLHQLTEQADCVLPVENEALGEICSKMSKKNNPNPSLLKTKDSIQQNLYRTCKDEIDIHLLEKLYLSGTKPTNTDGRRKSLKQSKKQSLVTSDKISNLTSAFGDMNQLVARLLTNLTSSMRFEGSLNVDLNEITTNLVPYPKLHFLISSMSPIVGVNNVYSHNKLSQIFSNAFQPDHQLLKCTPKSSIYLACGLLVRGDVPISDINNNINRLQSEVRMIHWNEGGFKVGLCNIPAVGLDTSLLCLSNNCAIAHTFTSMHMRFKKLYRRKAHVHHYTEFMDQDILVEAQENLQFLIEEYTKLENSGCSGEYTGIRNDDQCIRRLKPLL